MTVKGAKRQAAIESGLAIDMGKKREEGVMLQEQTYANLMSGLGSQPLDGPAPQIGTGGAQVAGGGGAMFSGQQVGAVDAEGKPIMSKRLGDQQVTARGTAEGSIFRQREVSTAGRLAAGKDKKAQARITAYGGGYELDPAKAAKQALESKQGQMMNRMVYEADQFLRGEGELYEEMKAGMTGPIMEGAAEDLDEVMANLQADMARGGSARNNAMGEMKEMAAQVMANAQANRDLSQASLQLKQWSQQNAAQTMSLAHSWASNQAGVREAYTQSWQAASNYMGTVALPTFNSANAARQAMRMAGNKTDWVSTAMGVSMMIGGIIAAPVTGGASLAVSAAGAGMAAGGQGVV